MQPSMPKYIYQPRLSRSMESTDLDRTASEIESSVDDLKTEVIYFREALQKLLEAAQEGIDQLEDL